LLLDQFVPVLPHLILPRRSNDTGDFSHKELQAGYLPVGGRTQLSALRFAKLPWREIHEDLLKAYRINALVVGLNHDWLTFQSAVAAPSEPTYTLRGRAAICCIYSLYSVLQEGAMKRAAEVQYVTDQKGRKTSVILPVETYEDMLEDIQDLVAVAERRKEKTLSLTDMKKRLKKDGLL
jgi:hypothetical protein